VQKRGRAAENCACHTCGRRLATHANEHCDSKYFDAIFDELMGTPGKHDSGVRDIRGKRRGFGARRASGGEEGVHLILAKSSMASAASAHREDSGRPEARLQIERMFSHTKYIAPFNTGHKCPRERVAADADGTVSRKGVVAFCLNEQGKLTPKESPSSSLCIGGHHLHISNSTNLNMSLCEQTSSVVFPNIGFAWGE